MNGLPPPSEGVHCTLVHRPAAGYRSCNGERRSGATRPRRPLFFEQSEVGSGLSNRCGPMLRSCTYTLECRCHKYTWLNDLKNAWRAYPPPWQSCHMPMAAARKKGAKLRMRVVGLDMDRREIP